MAKANGSKVEAIKQFWRDEGIDGLHRPYTAERVERLRGTVGVEYTLAILGARKLRKGLAELGEDEAIRALGAITGNQAVQQVLAGLKAIYGSGWQVAADGNDRRETYPDQSLYPAHGAPQLVERINNALMRKDQIDYFEGVEGGVDWMVPIIADAEAGFGGALNAYELMKDMIYHGAAGVHFEDQLSSAKKCGHLGGKVLVPTKQFINTLVSARLAADVMGAPTVLIARTDANSAKLITSDIDDRDKPFLTGDRTDEGFYRITGGLDMAIARGLAYAPHCDMIWCETSKPDLDEARQYAEGIHAKFPDKMLAYNCSPSFNWEANLDKDTIAVFQRELASMGYKFQFVTLAGFHALNHSMFKLAKGYAEDHMTAYSALQQAELASEADGYTATEHQREVGVTYFDGIAETITGGSSTSAVGTDSTMGQFDKPAEQQVQPGPTS